MVENIPIMSLEQAIQKAHLTRDLKFILLPWLQFRLYIQYNGREKKRGHYYGNEHQCTYNQCLYGKIPNIVLNKKKGYDDLLQFVEGRLKGQYVSAKLYMRDHDNGFNILCREYHKSKLVENTLKDPLLSEDEVRILYYRLDRGRLIIQEKDPSIEIKGIDFKKEVHNSLT